MESSELAELLKGASVVRSFLTVRLDERKNWNRSESMLQQVFEAFTQQIKFLQSVEKQVADGEQAIAGLNAQAIELDQELRPLKSRLAAEQGAIRAAIDERNRVMAELETHIESKRQKLAALESAIGEKATALGGLIARELV